MSEKGYARKLVDVLRSPSVIFESVTEKDFRKGLSIILLIAILASVSRYIYMQKTPINIPEVPSGPGGTIDTSSLRQMMSNIVSIAEFIRYVVELLLLATLIFTTGKMTTGGGSLRRFIAQAGLAYTPLLVQQSVRIAYVSINPMVVDQTLLASATQNTLTRMLDASLDVFNLFGIATLFLMVILVATDFKLKRKRALIYILIAYIILIILKTFTFL